jgi:uncharacterized membrane protein
VQTVTTLQRQKLRQMMMDILGFITLAVVGFTSCAEFGSYAFVHPVIRRLPAKYHICVEQGLLKTFGRVMPVLMTLSVTLAICSTQLNVVGGESRVVSWASALSLVAALVSTIIFNVPINLATAKWDVDNPPHDWKQSRDRWEFFQGLRSWLLLIGFALLCLAMSLRP